MKKILFIGVLLLVMAGLTFGQAMTNTIKRRPSSTWWRGDWNRDPAQRWAREVEDRLEGLTDGFNSIYFEPISTAPTATEGRVYYDSDDDCLKLYTAGAWTDIDVAGASSLGSAYTAGSKITAITDAVEIEVTDGSNNSALLIDHDEATNDNDAVQITNAADAATAVSIQIDGTAGYDIQGTGDTWQVGIDGQATFVGLTVTTEDLELENGAEIQNVVDTELRFIEDNGVADEDIILDFGTNVVTLKSGTAVDELAMGAVDDLTGVGTIAFDAAAGSITLTADAGTEDLTISQAGAVDASLILTSAGTGVDAVSISTTNAAGDIKVASTDNIDIDAADDITVNTADGSYTLTAAGGTNGDVTIAVGDILDVDSVDHMTFDLSGASADFHVDSAAGSVHLEGAEAAADAINIDATAGSIDIDSADNITIDAADDIGATTADGGITLTAAGGDNGDVTLVAADVMLLTSADTKIFDGAAAETWIIEGTADAHETSIVFTDPTADVTWTFPAAALDTFAVMASTLATNAPEIANSVTGGTNQLIFEGTDDAHETILTATDATADATLTLADDTGGIAYIPTGSTTKDATDAALPLTHAVVIGTSDADSAWSLPDGHPGQVLTVVIGTDGGEAVITPVSSTGCGWATVVLTDDIDGVTFMFVDATVGWVILGTFSDGTNIVEVTQ